jgi:pimeloyl-ACP methyl ester carboxylesterase
MAVSTSHPESENRLVVHLLLDNDRSSIGNHSYRVAAQVWANSTTNDFNATVIDAELDWIAFTAVCWISAMSPVTKHGTTKQSALSLELDLRWLRKAGFDDVDMSKLVIMLRDVTVQDATTQIPLFRSSYMPLQTASTMRHLLRRTIWNGTIDEEMLMGMRPSQLRPQLQNSISKRFNEESPSLLLVHGYCAPKNPWFDNNNDFTRAVYFFDPMQSISNDEFAQRLSEFTPLHGMKSVSIIAHSQGGAAATHLLNYYWSPMDNALNGRKIQSVGTPYLGCSGAGVAATLIGVFGFGCGENFDLSLDGSALWLSGISHESRSQVYYYTTTYELGLDALFDPFCLATVNLLLDWPNDGVTELDNAHLSGGNYMGNTEGQCHCDGMYYMPHYDDHERNQEMNARAAR